MSASERILYQADGLPVLQNRVYRTREDALHATCGRVELIEDLQTGLVRNAAFDPDLVIYDEDYQNEQGLSPLFMNHLESVADIVERQLGRAGLVEVGCGKGTFVELLERRGVDIHGFDTAYEGQNPRITRDRFAPGTAVNGDGIILRHVLEHVEDPVGFLSGLKDANGGRGRIYIEVPCFQWICDNRAWFDVFYEHVNYFRLHDFGRMFGEVIESGHLFGGQYLYIVAELASLRVPQYDPADAVRFPAEFGPVLPLDGEGPVLVWGASSKGVIYSLYRQRAGMPIAAAVDINPAKQGRFLPVTGVQVMSPEEAFAKVADSAVIHIMNSNYLEEIERMTDSRFRYVCIDREARE